MVHKNQLKRGFTIVELLIVIVVIGILAAITIVSYSGITARANTTKAQTNAANMVKVLEAYNADCTAYPSALTNFFPVSGKSACATSTSVPTGITVVAAASGALTSANGLTTVSWLNKSTTGGCLGYWDFTAGSVTVVYYGNASASTNFNAASPTCS